MKRVLLALLALLSVACARPTDRAKNSIVRITGTQTAVIPPFHARIPEPYTCTGFVVRDNLVLTANHCLGDIEMFADGLKVEPIRWDKYYDLALVEVKGLHRPALPIRDNLVTEGEVLRALGYANAYTHIAVLEERVIIPFVHAQEDAGGCIAVQPGFIEGMSGGPQLDLDGRVVGMVQQGIFYNAGCGVDAQFIKAFLHDAGVNFQTNPEVY